jgi:hypothetical protein
VTTSGEVLAVALAAEHAAIWGYGVVGAHLDDKTKAVARQAEAAHRTRRDSLIARLAGTAAGASAQPASAVPVAQPGYALPFAVTSKATAVRLAVTLEEGTARAWRQALAATNGAERKLVLDAYLDCAVRATRWRVAGKIAPTTVPFPGSPG